MTFYEIIRSLFGVWRLALIDKNGIHFFDNTRDRTLRSFAIPAISYLTLLLIAHQTTSTDYTGTVPIFVAMIVQTLGFVVSLTGYLIATHSLLDHLEKRQDFMRYVQIYNCMSIISFGLMLPIVLIGNSENPVVHFFFLMLMVFRKIYDWFIIQSVFNIQWYWILLILLGGEVIDALSTTMAYTIIY